MRDAALKAKLFIDNRLLIMYYNSKHLNLTENGYFWERSGKTRAVEARSRKIDMKTNMRKWIAVLAAVALLAMAVTPTVCALSFFSTFDELMGGDFGEILNELLSGNNGNNGNNGQNGFTLSDLLQNPGGMLDTLRERLADLDIDASNSTIAEAIMALVNGNSVSDLRELLNSNDFINQLADYIQQQQEASTTGNTPSGNTPSGNTPSGNTPSGGNDPTTAYNPSSNYPTDINTPSIVIPSVSYTFTYQGAQTYTTDPSSATSTTAVSTTAGNYSYTDPSVSYTNALTTVPFTPVYEDNAGAEKNSSGTKLAIGIGVLLVSAGAVVALVVMLKKNKA